MVGPPGLAKHRGFPSCLSLAEAGAAGHGSPGCVSVNPQELLFPSVSQCPLSVPQCLPCVPQCLPSISQCLPSVPKYLPSVPKCLSSVSQCLPSVKQPLEAAGAAGKAPCQRISGKAFYIHPSVATLHLGKEHPGWIWADVFRAETISALLEQIWARGAAVIRWGRPCCPVL